MMNSFTLFNDIFSVPTSDENHFSLFTLSRAHKEDEHNFHIPLIGSCLWFVKQKACTEALLCEFSGILWWLSTDDHRHEEEEEKETSLIYYISKR